jgi:hypothetical protein
MNLLLSIFFFCLPIAMILSLPALERWLQKKIKDKMIAGIAYMSCAMLDVIFFTFIMPLEYWDFAVGGAIYGVIVGFFIFILPLKNPISNNTNSIFL